MFTNFGIAPPTEAQRAAIGSGNWERLMGQLDHRDQADLQATEFSLPHRKHSP